MIISSTLFTFVFVTDWVVLLKSYSIEFFVYPSDIKLSSDTNYFKMNTLRNQVQLIGNLGQDLDFKSFENGSSLAKAPLATNEYYKNDRGEKIQETQWHNVVGWGKVAENMNMHLVKGDEVAVRGKLVHRKYEDAQGQTRYISEVVVNEFMKLSSKEK